MEQMFHKKAEAIKRLVEAAEEAHLNHEEDPDLQRSRCLMPPILVEITMQENDIQQRADYTHVISQTELHGNCMLSSEGLRACERRSGVGTIAVSVRSGAESSLKVYQLLVFKALQK
ncbi:Voltage-dependent calcium channel subunit alpha-2/delta-3 [Anabarilius grahami]|uniref:Voltage-dependent calcium channel subunit alpha-2/delta-3 n=1 Tax=Anabarilius grahami TaxID=495550 RepID=A0A3N0XMA8_ANAGA|nr:Voltage-dependent calcium channel subunit alpha-2/delta-3 [Anabarilius grahami]